MSEAAFKAALRREHNGAAPTSTDPKTVKNLNAAATQWLNRNDGKARNAKKLAKLKDRRDAEQALNNPALVNEYRRLILRGRRR